MSKAGDLVHVAHSDIVLRHQQNEVALAKRQLPENVPVMSMTQTNYLQAIATKHGPWLKAKYP